MAIAVSTPDLSATTPKAFDSPGATAAGIPEAIRRKTTAAPVQIAQPYETHVF